MASTASMEGQSAILQTRVGVDLQGPRPGDADDGAPQDRCGCRMDRGRRRSPRSRRRGSRPPMDQPRAGPEADRVRRLLGPRRRGEGRTNRTLLPPAPRSRDSETGAVRPGEGPWRCPVREHLSCAPFVASRPVPPLNSPGGRTGPDGRYSRGGQRGEAGFSSGSAAEPHAARRVSRLGGVRSGRRDPRRAGGRFPQRDEPRRPERPRCERDGPADGPPHAPRLRAGLRFVPLPSADRSAGPGDRRFEDRRRAGRRGRQDSGHALAAFHGVSSASRGDRTLRRQRCPARRLDRPRQRPRRDGAAREASPLRRGRPHHRGDLRDLPGRHVDLLLLRRRRKDAGGSGSLRTDVDPGRSRRRERPHRERGPRPRGGAWRRRRREGSPLRGARRGTNRKVAGVGWKRPDRARGQRRHPAGRGRGAVGPRGASGDPLPSGSWSLLPRGAFPRGGSRRERDGPDHDRGPGGSAGDEGLRVRDAALRSLPAASLANPDPARDLLLRRESCRREPALREHRKLDALGPDGTGATRGLSSLRASLRNVRARAGRTVPLAGRPEGDGGASNEDGRVAGLHRAVRQRAFRADLPADGLALQGDGILERCRPRHLIPPRDPRGEIWGFPDRRRDDPREGARGADGGRGPPGLRRPRRPTAGPSKARSGGGRRDGAGGHPVDLGEGVAPPRIPSGGADRPSAGSRRARRRRDAHPGRELCLPERPSRDARRHQERRGNRRSAPDDRRRPLRRLDLSQSSEDRARSPLHRPPGLRDHGGAARDREPETRSYRGRFPCAGTPASTREDVGGRNAEGGRLGDSHPGRESHDRDPRPSSCGEPAHGVFLHPRFGRRAPLGHGRCHLPGRGNRSRYGRRRRRDRVGARSRRTSIG